MSKVMYFAHLPGFSLSGESSGFAGMLLDKLPFDDYNTITHGAFEDYREKYQKTEPVFLIKSVDADLIEPGSPPGNLATPQFKYRSNNSQVLEDMGLGSINHFYANEVFYSWAALNLACPAAMLINPRYSTGVIYSEDGYFDFGGKLGRGLQIQGDADQEFLFDPSLCSSPYDEKMVREAELLIPCFEYISGNDELFGALIALVNPLSPVLTGRDHLILSVMALEELVLRGERRNLRKHFSQRVSSLVRIEQNRFDADKLARNLYDLRSAAIHGRDSSNLAEVVEMRHAPQMLCAVIIELAEQLQQGRTLDDVFAAVESGDFIPVREPVDIDNPKSRSPPNRLNKNDCSVVAVAPAMMGAPEGGDVLWSPLIGLKLESDFYPVGTPPRYSLMPLSSSEIMEMEDRDIRRDYLAGVFAKSELFEDEGGSQSVVLGVFGNAAHTNTRDKSLAVMQKLMVEASVVVIALRLAGLDIFRDPALLGGYYYAGQIRYRWPTVLRQTVLQEFKADTVVVDEDRVKIITQNFDRLDKLNQMDKSGSMSTIFSLYLASYHYQYSSPPSCAAMSIAVLEGILGRFRNFDDTRSIENIIGLVVSEENAEWFYDNGRAFRNDVAHGRFDTDSIESLVKFQRVVSDVLKGYVAFLSGLEYMPEQPDREFQKHVSDKLVQES